jgi:predicted transcriptional regulator
MSKIVVVTARITEELSADLDELARFRERSRAWLVEKAIAAFVERELDLYRSLEQAEAEIERGDYLTHEEFMAQLKIELGERRAA